MPTEGKWKVEGGNFKFDLKFYLPSMCCECYRIVATYLTTATYPQDAISEHEDILKSVKNNHRSRTRALESRVAELEGNLEEETERRTTLEKVGATRFLHICFPGALML